MTPEGSASRGARAPEEGRAEERAEGRSGPPLDPRLVRQVRAVRAHVLLQGALGLLQALCVITTALMIGRLGAALLVDREPPTAHPGQLALLVAALAVRALAVLVQQRTAHRAATATVADLRGRLVAHVVVLGPRGAAGRGADVATLATTGLEALRPYLVGYVPQLLLAATVTPLCILAVLLLDPTSALIAVLTLPLIPIFMILIGRLTQGRSEALIADMRTLWSQVLDLVDGLPTLRALGREKGPERTVHELGERHRTSAMGSLRYAFLSSMVLELLATLCVAIIAVGIGLRLVAGEMALAPALSVLVLAPELYLPLRQVGQQFHASTDGLAALDATFAVLEEPALPDGSLEAPDLRRGALALEGVSVRSRDGLAPRDAHLTLRSGRVLALTGPSGAGKTTAVSCLLGLLAPDAGRAVAITADGTAHDVLDLRRESLWDQITVLPQRPVVGPGTLIGLLREANPVADEDQIAEAARASGLAPVLAERGEDAVVGRGGTGLSLGERQRLALARAALSPAPVVILDEPTAHLDGGSERVVLDLIARWRAEGRAVLVVAHRSALVEIADDVVALQGVGEPAPAAPTDPEADA